MAEIFGNLVYFDDGTIIPKAQYDAWREKKLRETRPETIQARDPSTYEKVEDWLADKYTRVTGADPRFAQDMARRTVELGQWTPGISAAMALPEAKRLASEGDALGAVLEGAGGILDLAGLPVAAKGISEAASGARNAMRAGRLPIEARSTHELQPYAAVGSRVSERQVGVHPGTYLPSADVMSEAERISYAADPRRSWVDPATGKDILLQEVGADVRPTLPMQGVYDGPLGRETNPGFVARSTATPEQLAATEALRGFAGVQGGTPWTGIKMGDEPVMFVPHGGKGSLEDITALEKAGADYGFTGAYDVGDGYILTSFGGTPDTSAAARKAIRRATGMDPISTRVGGSYPAYETAWQGGGVNAVRQLLDYLDNADPAAVEKLNKSEAVSKRVQQKLMADFQLEKAAGGAMNSTVDEAVRTIARGPGWVDRLRDMSDRFGAREIPLQMPTSLRDEGGLLNATHFGPANLSEIDPAFAGSNPVITGGERALPAPYPKQSYLGVDVGKPGGYTPEPGLQMGGEYQFALPESRYADVNTFTEAKPGTQSITDEARAIVDRIAGARKGAMTDVERQNLQTSYEHQIAKQRGYFGLLNPSHDLGSIATSFYPLKTR